MSNLTVIGGTASQILAKKIAERIKAYYIKSESRKFPDGEIKTTINTIPKKGKIIVVQSCYPPVNDNLIETFALLSKARQYSSKVIAVIPYLGYARQDKEFLPGEVITIKVIAKMLQAAGASKIIVVDIHSKMALKYFKIPIKNISAVPILAQYFKKQKLAKPIVISPDVGGTLRAKEFARLLNTNFIALKKSRDRKSGRIKITSTNLKDVSGRNLIIIDDIISTGGSIIKATEFLKKQKCKKIIVTCTHGLLLDNAAKKITKTGVSRIISANTIPGKTSVIDISNTIINVI